MRLLCPSAPTAILSSTPDGLGDVLVDNWIEVDGVNVCTGLVSCGFWLGNCAITCFSGFDLATSSHDPVPPIDIANLVTPGEVSLSFELLDWGFALANSELWLVTNCQLPEEGKRVLCHKPGTRAQHTLQVAPPSVRAHLTHGDRLGACP